MIAIGDEDRSHLAGFERLDHLDAPVRLDLAVRHGDDVDATEKSPADSCDDERGNDQDEGEAHRGSRRLQNFQVCGKEPAVRDNGQSSLDGARAKACPSRVFHSRARSP